MDQRPIGIFDSGIGGLTVAKELRRLMPSESIVYVGDTANVPYGAKTPEELLKLSRQIIHFLLTKNVKAVVIACGTSSSITYEELTLDFPDLPIVDVIRPGVDVCIKRPDTRFGLIATAATIKSGVFAKLVHEKNSQITLHARACPLFASMVEAGLSATHPGVIFASKNYLSDLRGRIDALILGCTHYPLLTDALHAALGDVEFINLGEATANATKLKLVQHDLLACDDNEPIYDFYVSGSSDVFNTIGPLAFGENLQVSDRVCMA